MRDTMSKNPDDHICESCGAKYTLCIRHENPHLCPDCMNDITEVCPLCGNFSCDPECDAYEGFYV